MKRIISFLLCTIIIFSLFLISVSADNSVSGDDVKFIYEEEISEELKVKIESHLLGEEVRNTRGLGCVLFGHDIIVTTTTKITHKARTASPRCLEETYEVETCEDCDYIKSTLLDEGYIYCCS